MGLGLCWWVCGFWVCLVEDLVGRFVLVGLAL